MAFVRVEEHPYSVELVELSKLSKETFNPMDYLVSWSAIKVKHNPLISVADVGGGVTFEKSVVRVMARGIDRVTGEIYEPVGKSEDVSGIKFNKGDILVHKYSARIGRIGVADFEGVADAHFILVKTKKIEKYYLLLALRSLPVLQQLPYRETARPGIWNKDLEDLRIPRLDDVEKAINGFISEIFDLRKRAIIVLNDLLNHFDKAISSKMPTDYSFLMETSTLSDNTLDPGHYFMKAIEIMFPKHIVLGKHVDIIYPASLNVGDEGTAVTLSDYRFEGIVPERLKAVEGLQKSNFAKPGDIILNRLHSSVGNIAKATVVLPNIQFLREVGLTLREYKGQIRVPIYDQLFILRPKSSSQVSPYYLSVVFNSGLFQRMFKFLMSGSTGRQRLRKSKLELVKLPIVSETMMDAFSEATKICMEILCETLRMLIALTTTYEKVITSQVKPQVLSSLISKEKQKLKILKVNSLENVETIASKTTELQYEVVIPFLG